MNDATWRAFLRATLAVEPPTSGAQIIAQVIAEDRDSPMLTAKIMRALYEHGYSVARNENYGSLR